MLIVIGQTGFNGRNRTGFIPGSGLLICLIALATPQAF